MENNEKIADEMINKMEKVSDNKMTNGQIGFVGVTFSLAAYGGYSLFRTVSGFIRRKWNPDKELEREINNLKIKYPNSYVYYEERKLVEEESED